MTVAHDVPRPFPVPEYWRESARPFVSLVFMAPMLAAYEAGLVLLGPEAMRNGADVWLRKLLEWLGFGQYLLLPVLTCGILLVWHYLQRDRWCFAGSVLYGMLLESMVLAFVLVLLARLQGALLLTVPASPLCSMGACTQIVSFLGAGIYEELLFRLMLLSGLIALLRFGQIPPRGGLFLAVVTTSLLFAAAHYRIDLLVGSYHLVTEGGDSFVWTSFLFRFLAGSFFSAVFLCRGFGIAVGTHAMYDILVCTF
jgi:membrane protease YdiL (CAAX protease family)